MNRSVVFISSALMAFFLTVTVQPQHRVPTIDDLLTIKSGKMGRLYSRLW